MLMDANETQLKARERKGPHSSKLSRLKIGILLAGRSKVGQCRKNLKRLSPGGSSQLWLKEPSKQDPTVSLPTREPFIAWLAHLLPIRTWELVNSSDPWLTIA